MERKIHTFEQYVELIKERENKNVRAARKRFFKNELRLKIRMIADQVFGRQF